MQSNVAVAYSERDQRYMVAWRDDPPDADPRLYAQVLAADGTPDGAPFLLSESALDVGPPAIACEPDSGNFLVVWANQALAGGPHLLAQARLDLRHRGASLHGGRADGESTQAAPAVAFSTADNAFVVVWQDDGSPPRSRT